MDVDKLTLKMSDLRNDIKGLLVNFQDDTGFYPNVEITTEEVRFLSAPPSSFIDVEVTVTLTNELR